MDPNDVSLQEIRNTLEECEFPIDIIAKVISETNDPEKAFDRAVELNEERTKSFMVNPTPNGVIGDFKMVFVVRSDLPFSRQMLFQSVGNCGFFISYRLLSQSNFNS